MRSDDLDLKELLELDERFGSQLPEFRPGRRPGTGAPARCRAAGWASSPPQSRLLADM